MKWLMWVLGLVVSILVGIATSDLTKFLPSYTQRLARKAAHLRHTDTKRRARLTRRWEKLIRSRRSILVRLLSALLLITVAFVGRLKDRCGQLLIDVGRNNRHIVAATTILAFVLACVPFIATRATTTQPFAKPGTVSSSQAVLSPPTATRTSQRDPLGLDCPSGWICFYDQANYGYPRGRLSDCGRQDLTNWGWSERIDSVAFNAAFGSVSFYSKGVEALTHSDDELLFSLSPANRTIPNVAPFLNRAAYLHRIC
jgi:hypothetical protein